MRYRFIPTAEAFHAHIGRLHKDDIEALWPVQDILHTSDNPPEVRQAAYEYLLAHYTKLTLRAREQYRVQQQERAAQADADVRELKRRAKGVNLQLPDKAPNMRTRAYFSVFGGPIYLDEYDSSVLSSHNNFDFDARVLQPGETLKIANAYSPPARYRTEYQYAKCSCGEEYVSFTQDEVKVWIADHLAYVAETAYFDALYELEEDGPATGRIEAKDLHVEPEPAPLPVYGIVTKHYAAGEAAGVNIGMNIAPSRRPMRTHVAGEALTAGDAVAIGRDGKLYKATAPPGRVPTTVGTEDRAVRLPAPRWAGLVNKW
jgi:hypothetical protein